MAEEMLALLRDRLTPRERVQLIDMRNQTASTINEASELQSGTITRPERRPMEL